MYSTTQQACQEFEKRGTSPKGAMRKQKGVRSISIVVWLKTKTQLKKWVNRDQLRRFGTLKEECESTRNLIQSVLAIIQGNKNQAQHWRALFSLTGKQTSFETIQNIWKHKHIGQNISIKSQRGKDMRLPEGTPLFLCLESLTSTKPEDNWRPWRCWGLQNER